MLTQAITKYMSDPKSFQEINPMTANPASSGFDQVTDALIIKIKRARPVLFTTPLMVITPVEAVDADIDFLNVSDCKAGFAVLILRCLFIFFDLLYPDPGFFIFFITFCHHFKNTSKRYQNNWYPK